MYPFQCYSPYNTNVRVNRTPMHSMYGNYVPVFNLNVPGGGLQGPPMSISQSTPVYSSYTGDLIGNGPIAKGTPNDAPIGHKNYGKPFHVVEYNPANDTYMAHYRGYYKK